MRIDIDEGVAQNYPDLELVLRVVEGLNVQKRTDELEHHKRRLEEAIRTEGTADEIKDEPRVAA